MSTYDVYQLVVPNQRCDDADGVDTSIITVDLRSLAWGIETNTTLGDALPNEDWVEPDEDEDPDPDDPPRFRDEWSAEVRERWEALLAALENHPDVLSLTEGERDSWNTSASRTITVWAGVDLVAIFDEIAIAIDPPTPDLDGLDAALAASLPDPADAESEGMSPGI